VVSVGAKVILNPPLSGRNRELREGCMATVYAGTGTDTFDGTGGADNTTSGNDTIVVTNTNQISPLDLFNGDGGTDTLQIGDNGNGVAVDLSAAGTDPTHGFHSIEQLAFVNSLGTSSAIFNAAQFDSGLISTSLNVSGVTGAAQSIIITNASNFDASNWTFSTWGSLDTILIWGTGGNDSITGGTQADEILAGAGDDTVSDAGGNNTFHDWTGNDTYISLGGGNDLYNFYADYSPGFDTITDAGGNDAISIISATGFLTSLSVTDLDAQNGGDLVIWYNGSSIRVDSHFDSTNHGVESIKFNSAAYVGYALGSGSYLLSEDDSNPRDGGNQNDILVGSSSNGTLQGFGGNDLLFGNDGDDTLLGGAGNDLLQGGNGADTLIGGTDDDTYVVGWFDGTDTISEGGGGGTDRIAFLGGNFGSLNIMRLGSDLQIATDGKVATVTDHFSGNVVETITFYNGSAFAGYGLNGLTFNLDTDLTGGVGNDVIAGASANETIDGGAGKDLLFGDGGNDTITGGAGNDLIVGGAGTDTAVFSGVRSDYTITWDGAPNNSFIVTGPDGTDRLVGIENLHFTGGGSDIAICFMAGTMIRTPDGAVAVETLRRGDLVMTSDGRAVPVTWLGRQTISTRFADPLRVLPIRIRAGALGECLPARDLLVSPDHALFVGGVLVQAGALVNGSSIIRETAVPRTFVYYHVEVDDHSLIFAEDVPAETFIDNVDRLAFDNWDEHQALYPDGKAIAELPYPRAKAHRQVPQALRAQLVARSCELYGTGVVAAA
jgi:Ca2+-binding RTX toxin-like protein